VRALLAVVVAAVPAAVAAGDAVGSETCKACHPAAYEIWKVSPHARARDILPERHRNDAHCLACHAPQADDGFSGVGCEACHGPGRLYTARYVMRDAELARALGLVDPGEKACLACHTDSTPSLVRFEYARKVALIQHWGEGVPPPPPPPAALPGNR